MRAKSAVGVINLSDENNQRRFAVLTVQRAYVDIVSNAIKDLGLKYIRSDVTRVDDSSSLEVMFAIKNPSQDNIRTIIEKMAERMREDGE